jgi:DNA-binding transcriptional regulator YdaS (Cro superfamily)
MKLRAYRRLHRCGVKLARQAGISIQHLNKVCYGGKCSPEVAARISAATGGEVSVEEIIYPKGLPEGARLSVDVA